MRQQSLLVFSELLVYRPAMQLVSSICVAVACGAATTGIGFAQMTGPTVDWVSSWAQGAPITPGSRVTLELSGQVQDGWHVYALTQRPGGPTPLRVSIDENPIASLVGKPSGTPPQTRHDPSFDLDTEFYTSSFTVHVPVALNAGLEGGKQLIPVSVRFQTCSARECQPPKTVHLSVPVDVVASN